MSEGAGGATGTATRICLPSLDLQYIIFMKILIYHSFIGELCVIKPDNLLDVIENLCDKIR